LLRGSRSLLARLRTLGAEGDTEANHQDEWEHSANHKHLNL
jgi:hypothetical protein